MAFRNSLHENFDDFSHSSPQSPPSDSAFSSFPSPPGSQASFVSVFQQSPAAQDVRSTMQRRFTTDSTRFPSWSGFNPQPLKFPESLDILSSATHLHKSQLFEKKRQHIEYMREQKRRFEADLKLLDQQQEREKQEMDQIARDLAQVGLAGPVSEPTTPPEYRDSGFPTALSRPARFSISNGHSPSPFAGIFSPSQATSSSAQPKSTVSQSSNDGLQQSSHGFRRNSEQPYQSSPFTGFRPGHTSRYSLSAFGPSLQSNASRANGYNNSMGFQSIFSSKKVVEDEEDKPKDEERMSTPDVKGYLQMTDPDDKFPTLMRRGDNPDMLAANSVALDLANSRTPVPEANARHHSSHLSLPQNSLGWLGSSSEVAPGTAATTANGMSASGYQSSRHTSRLSLESSLSGYGSTNTTSHQPNNTVPHSRPTSLQMSYSTNDIPTARNGGFYNDSPPRSQIDMPSQNYSAHSRVSSMHRNGSSANTTPPTPQSSEHEDQGLNSQSIQSSFQVNGTPFSTLLASPTTMNANGSITPTPSTFASPVYGYGIQAFAPNTMQVNGNQGQAHTQFGAYGSQPYNPYGRFSDSPRTNQSRRSTDDNSLSRFGNAPLEDYQGELYGMCKDQHGCRYLQRKLEEGVPENIQIIFRETHLHVVELMTDPFGNYLCQKLLEFANDDQRTALINNAAPHLVQIALNQHGTRALQKMIEFISTSEQTQMVINALRDKVVDLVQDLNGNHVIQKCLNRLAAPDAQFIFDAVGASCVTVGTHRHGCCVLQRCIDHASGDQRARLIAQITTNAYALVQDPFGNYVIQYILDLAEPQFTEPLCQTFLGNISALSKQKFSSNVIEKCIRTADPHVQRAFVREMLGPNNELERMLRDSFANYVVQTAMDFVDAETRNALIDAIRPILPAIRQTPHGRRISGKIMTMDTHSRSNSISNGQVASSAAGNEDGLGYRQSFPLTATAGQFPSSQFNVPDTPTSGPLRSPDLDSTSDGGSSTIFSPIPQHTNHAINGINGINGVNGVNGSNSHGYNMF